MSKLIKVESSKKDFVKVEVDAAFMSSLPPKFSHLECQRCHCAQFNIGVWPEAVKVGCRQCSWEIEIPFRIIGEAHILLPV